MTAIAEAYPRYQDAGIQLSPTAAYKYSGDITKASPPVLRRYDRLAVAGTDESPGELISIRAARLILSRHGSLGAMARAPANVISKKH